MIRHITVINGASTENDFISIFTDVARAAGLTASAVSSRDCAVTIDRDGHTSVICADERLDTPERGTFIKRHKQDAYFTYLMEKVLRRNGGGVFTDPAHRYSANSADKMTTTLTLALQGLPVPASILCTPRSFAKNEAAIRAQVSFPCVLKKAGTRGKQVWKIADAEELVEKLTQDENLTLIQEYLPNDHDFRVVVCDGTVLAAIKRTTADGFYNNISQGGTALPGEITPEEAAMCVRATEIAELRISGVDFVRTESGPRIFEVNKSPQLNIFNGAAGFDLERAVSEHVIQQLTR